MSFGSIWTLGMSNRVQKTPPGCANILPTRPSDSEKKLQNAKKRIIGGQGILKKSSFYDMLNSSRPYQNDRNDRGIISWFW